MVPAAVMLLSFIGVAHFSRKSMLNSKKSEGNIPGNFRAKILYIAPRATAKMIWSVFFHLQPEDKVIF